MPLSMAQTGETNYIKRITGNDDVRQHLARMGFVIGGCVTVVSKIAGGNMILNIKNSRIALDQSMTNRIMV